MTSNNMPIDSTWKPILLAALNRLNLTRAGLLVFFYCEVCDVEGVTPWRKLYRGDRVHVRSTTCQCFCLAVCAADRPSPSFCTSDELCCCNLLILPPCRSNCGFDVRAGVGLDIAWEQR